MPRLRARRLLALLATAGVAALVGTAPAHAAPFVDVTYDLGDSTAISTIPLIGVTVTVPPNGTVQGTQTLRYTGGSGSYTGTGGPTLATGPVDLVSFNLYVQATITTVTYTPYGGTGPLTLAKNNLHIEFLSLTTGARSGSRRSGGTVLPFGAYGRFRVTGDQHCYVLCGALKVPQSTLLMLIPHEFTAPLPTLTGAVGQSQTVRGTARDVVFVVEPNYPGARTIGVTGTTQLVGREIRRTAVPEPGTLPLLLFGLSGTGLVGAAWRRWRALGPQ